MIIKVIGAGLAGSEAAYRLAMRGYRVELWDIKPKKMTPAHKNANFGELVCSNSLKGKDPYSNACGLLKEEMRVLGSLTMEAAAHSEVPAGGALAVDRDIFAAYITDKLRSLPIKIVCKEAQKVPKGPCIIATGPLTTGKLYDDISAICGGQLHFYDASAPIVAKDGIDFGKCFAGDRYGKGGDDYLNCPLTQEEYYSFVDELTRAQRVTLHGFEKREIFEGCMPVEVMAERGRDSLRFAMLKPVGLDNGGNKHFAVLQLRKENAAGGAYNLVGFQTNLKFGEQKRVFGMIPALKNAEFLRYGVMHRNTYINSPACLNADLTLKDRPNVCFAGQITGVEGYVESAAVGILAAENLMRRIEGKEILLPPPTTVMGALVRYVTAQNKNFEPMNANFGLLPPLAERIRDKRQKYGKLAERALEDIKIYSRKTSGN